MSDAVERFTLAIPEAQIVDLRERLANTRWPDRETTGDASQGPRLDTIRALCEYWRTAYDWRRCESALNGAGQFTTALDGLRIHFLHVRSPEPGALPLLMTHGWPGSVVEFLKVIGPLTDPANHGGRPSDAFHLVLPSLPGFGFSEKPTETGWGPARTADAWISLMARLGYARWCAQGGDFGAVVTDAIAAKSPAALAGVHFNFVIYQPTPDEVATATPHEQAMLASVNRYTDVLSGYFKEQTTRPQTIGYALADSPVAQAAWIYTLFEDLGAAPDRAESSLTRDEILDDIMLYWLPNAGATAARMYWEALQTRWMPSASPAAPTSVPTGISVFPGDFRRISRRWAERRYANLVRFNELDRGGHFAAFEEPERFVEELRATFRPLR